LINPNKVIAQDDLSKRFVGEEQPMKNNQQRRVQ
jgi:hypothetical protein